MVPRAPTRRVKLQASGRRTIQGCKRTSAGSYNRRFILLPIEPVRGCEKPERGAPSSTGSFWASLRPLEVVGRASSRLAPCFEGRARRRTCRHGKWIPSDEDNRPQPSCSGSGVRRRSRRDLAMGTSDRCGRPTARARSLARKGAQPMPTRRERNDVADTLRVAGERVRHALRRSRSGPAGHSNCLPQLAGSARATAIRPAVPSGRGTLGDPLQPSGPGSG